MAITTNVSPLKINYLTQAQYDAALANNEINANELYFTPYDPGEPCLPLTGGTMTGGITLVGNQSSAYNDKGLIFTDNSRIGENSSGDLGIYGARKVFIRPSSSSSASSVGIEVNDTEVLPGTNDTESLGSSSKKWLNVYATTFHGDLDGSATSLASLGTIGSSSTNHATALQGWFNNNKATTPRNQLIHFYDASNGNGSATFGYFLSGYNDSPYGGFFSAHYNTPYYIGINNGTYTESVLLSSTNYTSYTVTKTGTGASGTWGISISGNATSSSYPQGFVSRTTASSWGNTTGTHVTGWSYTGSCEIAFLANNPSSGKLSVKVDGRYYGNEGNSPAMLMNYTNSYWGMGDPDGNSSVWIRTTTQGIIPSQSGAKGSGHCSLGTSSWYFSTAYIDTITSNKTYGAVWNDYAEFRKDNPIEKDKQQPGRCVHELGDGSLALTTKRLMRGCEIISDTFGFAIGQDEENGYNTPIASSGRVLAYPYESIEEFKNYIGYAVCSGPNGTVSIMTEEEEEKYPMRAIGTISEIPDYEEWGTGKVKVNGRIWIRIR